MKKLLSILFLSFSINPLFGSSLEVALGALKFDYNEYLDNGTWLDSETNDGFELNGGFIRYEHSLGEYKDGDFIYDQSLELQYSFHYNKTDYNGYLQNLLTGTLTPYSGSSNNYLHQTHIRYKAVNTKEENNLGLFIGLGYRYWDRDLGYLETYEWPYYEAGLSWKWYDKGFYLGLEASYQKAYKPTMYLHAYGGLDFDLGKTDGYKFHVPLGYIINDTWSIAVHYIYDKWDISRSNTLQGQTSVGVRSFYEPQSETKNQYTYLSVKYIF